MLSGSRPAVVLAAAILFVSSVPDAASYSKYGRTCKDIGCKRDEVCVMTEDPCSYHDRDNCGRYPTCAKARPGETGCSSILCQENEFCRTENGVPTCVKRTAANGYESAGVSYVNGERVSSEDGVHNNAKPAGTNSNPYANANAPPPPLPPADPIAPGSTGVRLGNPSTNLGYPPYPNPGSNNGYPPYPPAPNQPGRTNLGYPPYPQNYPQYPGHQPYPQQPGYPPAHPSYPNQGYPNQGYPNQQNRYYSQNANSVYRRNHGSVLSSPSGFLLLAVGFLLLVNRS